MKENFKYNSQSLESWSLFRSNIGKLSEIFVLHVARIGENILAFKHWINKLKKILPIDIKLTNKLKWKFNSINLLYKTLHISYPFQASHKHLLLLLFYFLNCEVRVGDLFFNVSGFILQIGATDLNLILIILYGMTMANFFLLLTIK